MMKSCCLSSFPLPSFFNGLEHKIETSFPMKVKKKLKSHFKSLDEDYKEPKSFQLNILHPLLSYLQLPIENNLNIFTNIFTHP